MSTDVTTPYSLHCSPSNVPGSLYQYHLPTHALICERKQANDIAQYRNQGRHVHHWLDTQANLLTPYCRDSHEDLI